MERIKVLKQINFDTDVFLTSLEKLPEIITEHKELLEKDGWSDIFLKMEYYYDGSELIIMGYRLENDEEFTERVKLEEANIIKEQKRLDRERKMYEKLKEKFG